MNRKALEDRKLKKLFEERRALARKNLEVALEFDKKLSEYYDFPFNETDNDEMIDTLDYGTNSISFEEFIKRMEHYSIDIRKTYID